MELSLTKTKQIHRMSAIRIIVGMVFVTILAFADTSTPSNPVTPVSYPDAVTDSCLYYQIKISEQLRITDSLLTKKYNHEH